MNFTQKHLKETAAIANLIDSARVEEMILKIAELKNNQGRIFFIGVGGSAANASHAVNDFRKLAGIESYAPTDNISISLKCLGEQGFSFSVNCLLITPSRSRNAILDLVIFFTI